MNMLRQFEKKYLYRICESQIFHLYVIDFCCILFGLTGYFLLAPTVYRDLSNGKKIYSIYLICCLIMSLYLIIGKIFIKKENEKGRYHFCNAGIILTTQLYFLWSYAAIYYSAIDSGKVDYLPWLFVYIVCVTSFFYRHYTYLFISVLNITLLLILAFILYRGIYDIATHVYALILVVLLIIIYVSKHIRELREFDKQLKYELSVESKTLFTASMNHELRTPLNSVIGNAQILLTDESLKNSQREITENIFNSSKIMVQLVNDLLDYSKIEAGEFSIIQNEFNLLELRNTLSIMMGPLALDKNLDFAINIEEGTPIDLIGDMQRIQQIVTNVISNGIKYTSSGSVKTSFSFTERSLKVVTIDTGMGMSEDTISEMFSPYKRINEQKTTTIQGTGLGMFVVKKLIDKMEGDIVVHSIPDIGSTFQITIPVTVTEKSAVYHKDKHGDNTNPGSDITYDFTGKVILSIDDTMINNKIIENILESVNATAYCCLDAENCIKFISMHHVDAILMDHIMPGTNGLDCLKAIRNSDKPYKDIPIIMVSGNTSEDDIRIYKENGANDFLAKPVIVEDLFKKLQKILY